MAEREIHDCYNRRRKELESNIEWSQIYPLGEFYENSYAALLSGKRWPTVKAGVYCLLKKTRVEYEVFYVGQSKCIMDRLLQHMYPDKSWGRSNPCIEKHIREYDCYFRYVLIKHWGTRNKIERELIAKYKPKCNRSPGITKQKKTR